MDLNHRPPDSPRGPPVLYHLSYLTVFSFQVARAEGFEPPSLQVITLEALPLS